MKKIFLLMFIVAAVSQEAAFCAEAKSVFAAGSGRFVYNDKGKRDPFLPLLDHDGNIVLYDNELILTDLKLEGIMLSSKAETSVAIINGRIIKIHDRIGSFQVEKILKNRIVLKKGQEFFELKLKKE